MLLDTSASMVQTPAGATTSRWSVAQGLMREPWTRRVAADCALDVYPFDSDIRPSVTLAQAPTNTPQGKATSLRETLRKIADRHKGQNVAGVLLLSDGLDTRELHSDWAGDPSPYPIYTVRLEPPDVWESEPDVRIVSADTPRRVVVGCAADLKVDRVVVEDIVWGGLEASVEATVALRYRMEPVAATVTPRFPAGHDLDRIPAGHHVGATPVTALDIELHEPVSGVAPGQAAVVYAGEVVLGGGVVSQAR